MRDSQTRGAWGPDEHVIAYARARKGLGRADAQRWVRIIKWEGAR